MDIFKKKVGKILFNEMDEVVETSINILKKEFSPHKKIQKTEKLILIGDLHGDFDTFIKILETSKFLDNENYRILFLGDYADRGMFQVEVYFTILTLKTLFKNRIIMLRGNHEVFDGYEPIPHDFPRALLKSFGFERAQKLYEKFKELWSYLPYSASYRRIFFVHGGIPVSISKKQDILNPNDETIVQLLWNDPKPDNGFEKNIYRNVGYIFGPDITKTFLEKTGFTKIIRGHEVCNGFKTDHDGKILTVFSSKVYGNKNSGFLVITKEGEKRILL